MIRNDCMIEADGFKTLQRFVSPALLRTFILKPMLVCVVEQMFLCSITTRLQWKSRRRREYARRCPERVPSVFISALIDAITPGNDGSFWFYDHVFLTLLVLAGFVKHEGFSACKHTLCRCVCVCYGFVCETLTGESKCISTEICYIIRPECFGIFEL